jgi:hypothetical protein
MVVKRVAMAALPMNNSLEWIPSEARIILLIRGDSGAEPLISRPSSG